mmetsp:Transcript_25510/g.73675  ORF Transcript_25510/g.73675 Transcript_25510/m.73675 type:complete len:306 (+) Transcript_25510:910-1827(+)
MAHKRLDLRAILGEEVPWQLRQGRGRGGGGLGVVEALPEGDQGAKPVLGLLLQGHELLRTTVGLRLPHLQDMVELLGVGVVSQPLPICLLQLLVLGAGGAGPARHPQVGPQPGTPSRGLLRLLAGRVRRQRPPHGLQHEVLARRRRLGVHGGSGCCSLQPAPHSRLLPGELRGLAHALGVEVRAQHRRPQGRRGLREGAADLGVGLRLWAEQPVEQLLLRANHGATQVAQTGGDRGALLLQEEAAVRAKDRAPAPIGLEVADEAGGQSRTFSECLRLALCTADAFLSERQLPAALVLGRGDAAGV